VAMQVEVLKLNAGIGRSLERSSSLQGQNELLRANLARLSDEQRIERLAAQMGMVMPAPTQLRFVRGGPSSVEKSLSSIHAPDGTSFISALPTIGAPAAAQGTSVNTGVGVTPTTASSTQDSSSASTTPSSGSTDTTVTSGASGTTASGTATGDTGTSTSTPTGTDSGTSGTSGSSSGSTSGTPTMTPAAPTTSAGATDQSGSTSTGGAAPVGG